MREIKFRLIQDGKIAGYERHEYDLVTDTTYIFHGKENDNAGYNIEAVEDAYIPHQSKEQFTGLFDKNGKEIYEGDRVKVYYDCIDKKGWHTGTVRYDLTKGGCFTYSGFFVFNLRLIKSGGPDIEIVGNIHTKEQK